jgi:NodT family efflux transporter outer membrane factor (OMF) lipoprotein
MSNGKRWWTALRMLPLVALAACKEPLPPATPVPPAPTATGYDNAPLGTSGTSGTAGSAQRFTLGADVPGQWWTLFHSAALSALVDEGMRANPDVAAAQAALRSARESFYAQRASAYPTAQGAFSVSREQTPLYYAPPLNTNASEYVYGVHTAELDVAYTPDVFGNLRYQTATAAAATDIARFQVEATYLTLTSNIAAAAFAAAGLRGQLDVTRRIIAIEQRALALTKLTRTYAQAAGLDVLTQEAALRATEQTVPGLEKQLDQDRDALARLVGRTPNDDPAAAFDLAALHLPTDLPLSLPSQLIDDRPDIAAARANVVQTGAQVGVAYTNRLPNFAITAQTATQALSLGGLFGAGSLLSTLTAAASTTFYDHGTLKHREASAIAAYDEAAASYRGAVLTGLQNVADALAALRTDADALRAAVRSDQTAAHALQLTRYQEEYGQVSALATLNAEQAYQQAELTLVQAQATRYVDTAALFEALGGGWWNRSETQSPP